MNDITGLRFGRWTVSHRLPGSSKNSLWRCICDCGNNGDIYANNLRRGLSTQCACCRYQAVAQKVSTHGMSKTREFRIWTGMLQRCSNPEVKSFSRYGGRGISVCDRWQQSFESFLADMGRCPGPRSSIDRIDNDGNYEPGNCRWATNEEQANNRRGNTTFVVDGEGVTLARLLGDTKVSRATYYSRVRRGIPPAIAATVSGEVSLRSPSRIAAEQGYVVAPAR